MWRNVRVNKLNDPYYEFRPGDGDAVMSDREAFWQYLIDHSRPASNDAYFVRFYLKNKRAFFNKIDARVRGDYKRKEESVEQERLKRKSNTILKQLKQLKQLKENKATQCALELQIERTANRNNIRKSNNVINKVLLYLHTLISNNLNI